MKLCLFLICLVGIASAAPAPAKPSEPEVPKEAIQGKNVAGGEDHDASSNAIKIPVDNANKLLYDLDAQVRQLFDESSQPIPKEAVKEEKSDDGGIEEAQSYSAANRELDFHPRQSDASHQASLVTQLENLEKRLLTTINELQNRRRYFSSTMLRQMYNSVHRIRVNISRIQNQFSAPHSVSAPSPQRPGQSGIMNGLQQRVTDIQKAVNDIINRVTSSFQGPNAQKPAGQTVQLAY